MSENAEEIERDLNDSEWLRDRVRLFLEDRGYYTLAQRLAFVPTHILKRLLNRTPQQATMILDKEGY